MDDFDSPDVRTNFAHTQKLKDRVRINVWIPYKIFSGVMDIAKSEDETMTDVLKHALKDYISNYRKRLETDSEQD